jgi:transcription antitermination factor NusG
MRSGKPDLMQDSVLADLRNQEREGLILLEKYRKGDKVNLVKCAFAGWSGIYQEMSAKARCRVMLDMLGGQVPVNVELDCLIKAAA